VGAMMNASGGSGGSAPVIGGSAAMPVAGTGAAPMMGTAGAAGSTTPTATAGTGAGSGGAGGAAGSGMTASGAIPDIDMLRQHCVDTVNMYRTMVSGLQPMKRASAAQEECSDRGAQMDGDSMQAHGSARAGLCRSVGLGGENTCPGYPVGGFSGAKTLADALDGCLKQMWGEGEPPVSRSDCQADYSGCFLKYGHYLNMTDPNNHVVSCGFYKMMNGSYWMNQDFAF
jgi:hypothetical protein